jgi:hypothetical protein
MSGELKCGIRHVYVQRRLLRTGWLELQGMRGGDVLHRRPDGVHGMCSWKIFCSRPDDVYCVSVRFILVHHRRRNRQMRLRRWLCWLWRRVPEMRGREVQERVWKRRLLHMPRPLNVTRRQRSRRSVRLRCWEYVLRRPIIPECRWVGLRLLRGLSCRLSS